MGEIKLNNIKNSDKFLSQVVIRHLPPTMTEDQFKNEISPVPDHNYFHFLKADLSLGQWAFTRACINFTQKDDIFVFKDKFDGYVFVDANGTEYPAIVEFSPYQKIPRRRVNSKNEPLSCKKRDTKCGTIEDDPDYKSFIENLNDAGSQKNLPSAEVYLEEIEAREKELKANHGVVKVTTPLIEFIKQKKAEKLRLKEERREERRRQMEQKRSSDIIKKDDKLSNTQQFKVKQRDRKNKMKEGSITVAKNEKRERDKEKEKEKEKEKGKAKEKEKNKDKDRDDKKPLTQDRCKEKPKQLEKDKDRLPERERERKRDRHRKKEREIRENDNDSNKPGTSTNKRFDREFNKEGEKETKKDKNVDKNRYFVVTYSGDKNGARSHDSNRRGDSNSNKQSQQPKMDISQNGDEKSQRKDNETSNGQSITNHLESNKSPKESKRSESQRVRNKDRPALEIYRPRRALNQHSNSSATSDTAETESKPERNIRRTKVFTRSRNTD